MRGEENFFCVLRLVENNYFGVGLSVENDEKHREKLLILKSFRKSTIFEISQNTKKFAID